jgi:hypothetical protein
VGCFQGIRCPYELLASIYHIALPFEKYILDERSDTGPNKFGAYTAQMDFDQGVDSFNIDPDLFHLSGMVPNERQAALLVFELLNRLDVYLSGTEDSQNRLPRV